MYKEFPEWLSKMQKQQNLDNTDTVFLSRRPCCRIVNVAEGVIPGLFLTLLHETLSKLISQNFSSLVYKTKTKIISIQPAIVIMVRVKWVNVCEMLMCPRNIPSTLSSLICSSCMSAVTNTVMECWMDHWLYFPLIGLSSWIFQSSLMANKLKTEPITSSPTHLPKPASLACDGSRFQFDGWVLNRPGAHSAAGCLSHNRLLQSPQKELGQSLPWRYPDPVKVMLGLGRWN